MMQRSTRQNPPDPGIDEHLPRRWSLKLGTIMLVSALLWTWLYLHAETVAPETHSDYVRVLRELRDADNTVNATLLASRLELIRNYDALTHLNVQTLELSKQASNIPDFVHAPERTKVLEAALAVQKTLETKAQLIESFKRENSVTRNSLAYFPVAGSRLLTRCNGAERETMERYLSDILIYSRTLDPENNERIQTDRRLLNAAATAASASASAEKSRDIANLLRHGDAILIHLPRVDQLTRQILALKTSSQLDALGREYAYGRTVAVQNADLYRRLLYVLALLVTAYLVYTFVRLDRAQHSLALANREIRERYAAQQLAEARLRLHASAFQSAHEGITLTDVKGNILDVNPAFTRITGWTREEVLGKNPRLLRSTHHSADFYNEMWQAIRRDGNWKGEIWNRNRDGETYPELLSISCVRDAQGRPMNYVGVFSDISELKAQESKLAHMAFYDPLTGLPNRTLLADRMKQAMLDARRSNNNMVAICFLDLDQFKPINDAWGHEMGDQVLIAMATRLTSCVRAGDTVARFGGDEFVLLMHIDNAAECTQAMNRVLQYIAQPLHIEPHPMTLSVSIGVTLFPSDGVDPDTLLRHADQAMYQAKQAGKNRYCLFDPEKDRQIALHHDLLERLRVALRSNELRLHFQPKVNLSNGEIIGAEALIRWQHPERGLLEPADFLYRIDGNELEIGIGEWVIDNALQQLAIWVPQGVVPTISVNISANHLLQPNFIERLRQALARYPTVPTGSLELEILESASLTNMEQATTNLSGCRELGVTVALDDFGTGYSTLAYFRNLAVDTIKIDQSFVRDMLLDPNDLEIVESMVKLARAFNRTVIAEGVETLEHGALLVNIGCPLCQGYGIAYPMPVQHWPDWIAQWRQQSAWTGMDAGARAQQDLSLRIAMQCHGAWIEQVVKDLPLPPSQQLAERNPKQCQFGRWYLGGGSNRYGRLTQYHEIGPLHEQAHAIAQELLNLARDGQTEAAHLRVPELYAVHAHLLQRLQTLEQQEEVTEVA